MAREQKYLFSVKILGVGSIKIIAETIWVAMDRAYSLYQRKQPNRKYYYAKRVAY
jgi:hypothetical protein